MAFIWAFLCLCSLAFTSACDQMLSDLLTCSMESQDFCIALFFRNPCWRMNWGGGVLLVIAFAVSAPFPLSLPPSPSPPPSHLCHCLLSGLLRVEGIPRHADFVGLLLVLSNVPLLHSHRVFHLVVELRRGGEETRRAVVSCANRRRVASL